MLLKVSHDDINRIIKALHLLSNAVKSIQASPSHTDSTSLRRENESIRNLLHRVEDKRDGKPHREYQFPLR